MNYTHLITEERSCIRKYYVDGLSYRKIAELIGRSPRTGSREIRRNCTHMYDIPTYYPSYGTEKVFTAAFLLPSRNVPVTANHRVYKRKAAGHMVTGTNRKYPL